MSAKVIKGKERTGPGNAMAKDKYGKVQTKMKGVMTDMWYGIADSRPEPGDDKPLK